MNSTRISCHINAPRASVYRALLDARAIASHYHVLSVFILYPFAFILLNPTSTSTITVVLSRARLLSEHDHGSFPVMIRCDSRLLPHASWLFGLVDTDGGTGLLAIHDGLPRGVSPDDNETGWRMALEKLAARRQNRGFTRAVDIS